VREEEQGKTRERERGWGGSERGKIRMNGARLRKVAKTRKKM
jgi:hypothetical protein